MFINKHNSLIYYILQAFLGNRYGSRPYPSEIQADEYELLYGVAADLSLDVKLLDGWYKKDRNAVPLVYKLLPITFKLRYYDSTNPRHTEKRTRVSHMTQLTSIQQLQIHTTPYL